MPKFLESPGVTFWVMPVADPTFTPSMYRLTLPLPSRVTVTRCQLPLSSREVSGLAAATVVPSSVKKMPLLAPPSLSPNWK